MKLKKTVKRNLIIIGIIVILVLGIFAYIKFYPKEKVKEVKIVNKIEKYGYKLKDNKPTKYKNMFKELKEILTAKNIDEESYVKKITEMYIYDFYSLDDKTAKTDVGGVDFVYEKALDNYLLIAEDTYYKYVESNIYNNRKQLLPIVSEITIDSVERVPFAYAEETDEEAYKVKASWTYTDETFNDYQKEATLIFIHDGIKLSLVELK